MSNEMKVIMERWDSFVLNEQEGDQRQGFLAKVAGGVSSVIAKGFEQLDDFAQKDYCEKKFPLQLKNQDGIQTWGDLNALLKCGIEYRDRANVLGILVSFLPGARSALEAIKVSQDVSSAILRMYQVEDDKRPEGNLGKLDMDDSVARIIDDKVERAFLKFLIDEISKNKNLAKDIDPNWNITVALQNFLKDEKNGFKGRTVTGFQEK